MKNTTCLITGAETNIGNNLALGLAKQGATVVLVTKDLKKSKDLRIQLIADSKNPNIDLAQCDLSDLDQVRRFAADFADRYRSLDVVAHLGAPTTYRRLVTPQGNEWQFAHHVLGPFLLTTELLDLMQGSVSARIINRCSENHRIGTIYFEDPALYRAYSPVKARNQIALGQVLWSFELAERLRGSGITVNAFCPGKQLLMAPARLPALLHSPWKWFTKLRKAKEHDSTGLLLNLASSPAYNQITSQYFVQGKKEKAVPITYDQKFRRRFWQLCEELTATSLSRV